ncbi:MAG: hypothetical protein PHX80_04570 [Candidatus Nanoarchaeia archaeon]|nr:hypothetical protein [Candidatus Nanoarchaeia archaeon]
MTLIEKLNEQFTNLKVTEQELPDKTKRKLASLRDLYNCKLPSVRDKQTGQFNEKTKTKIRDLVEDIMAETQAYIEVRDEGAEPPVKGTEPPVKGTEPPVKGTEPPDKKKKKGGGFLDIMSIFD